ncbi:MAG: DinB family protein [Gemmatimonadaceae bacterium]
MPTLLHDPAVRDSLRARVRTLRPDSERLWGRMTVDQMLWHVNQALRNSLGDFEPAMLRVPLPRPLLKFIAVRIPWPKGAPTAPEFTATSHYSFDAERDRCLALIERTTHRNIDEPGWGRSAAFGRMSGRDWSRLNAKHLNHHLKQFGV